MSALNKYLALFMLERKETLEEMLNEINSLKFKLKDTHPWVNSLVLDEVIYEFYSNYNTDIHIVDTILHYVHVQDESLRGKVNLLVSYYLKVYTKFHTGFMESSSEGKQINEVRKILSNNNINFEDMSVKKTNEFNSSSENLESIYIKFLNIDRVIDRRNVEKLLKVFPDGWKE